MRTQIDHLFVDGRRKSVLKDERAYPSLTLGGRVERTGTVETGKIKTQTGSAAKKWPREPNIKHR